MSIYKYLKPFFISLIMILLISFGSFAEKYNSNLYRDLNSDKYTLCEKKHNLKNSSYNPLIYSVEKITRFINSFNKKKAKENNTTTNSNKVEKKSKDKNNDINKDSNKVIYLTFDDGPSKNITPKILDILKRENIKATFFIIGKKGEENKDILKRIVDEGHSIGNHTYSHDYKYLYDSPNNFINELYRTRWIIQSTTNVDTKLIRFPGGSNNSFVSKDTLKNILANLKNEGFVYFDWNVSSDDASRSDISRTEIESNVLKWINTYNKSIILFHDSDSKNNTLEALPKIIKKLKSSGYTFDALSEESFNHQFINSKNLNSLKETNKNTKKRLNNRKSNKKYKK